MAGTRYSLNNSKFLLPPESAKLRQLIHDYRLQDTRNCLLIDLALRTGARAQELLNLTAADLNTFDQSVLIQGIKGSNDREIPLAPGFFQELVSWSQKSGQARIFSISYERLVQIWQIYRPVPKKFHSLRHTFAIELFQRTKDLRLVQVALGHRNIQNTMIYADYIYSKQELRRLLT